MSQDKKRNNAGQATTIPRPPPLPAPRPLPLQQRARDAASRFLGFPSRPPSPQSLPDDERFTRNSIQTRSSSIGATQDATTTHRTGLEIKTISINERGSHAIIAGKAIFKTVKVEDGHCAEDFNLRTAIRSTPTQASGQPRQVYEIDIADVAWAKGDTGDFVAAATSSGKIIVYDLGHAGLQAAQLHEHYRQVHNVTFNPHRGSLLLSGSQDGTVRLWDIRDCRSQASAVHSKRKFSGQSDGVRDVKWSPTEGFDFAFGTDHGDVQRWDMRNLKAAKVRIPAHGLSVNTVDWHPDGKHIMSASSDKTVRVFDVSSSRPKKASWEIKTAHPVMLARWRPACQSIMPHDNGAQQCTQIVTAYDREHPMMHVWDFRRPLLPFRELQPYQKEAPTDMLWHSQDLLWTVGREGIFLQSDIQHTPKVIERCNVQAVDISARGEMTLVAQRRRHRRKPTPQQIASLHAKPTSSSLGTSPDSAILSRSWADDSLDHSFLSVLPFKRQGRSSSGSRTHGAHVSSTQNHNLSATIKLDDILFNRKSFRPQQVSCRGELPSHNSSRALEYFAERYKMARNTIGLLRTGSRAQEHWPTDEQVSISRPLGTTRDLNPALHAAQQAPRIVPISAFDAMAIQADMDLKDSVREVFEDNEAYAQQIGFHSSAQTWNVVRHCVDEHLRDAIRYKKERLALHAPSPPTDQSGPSTSIETLAKRLAVQHQKSPAHSPGTIRPASTLAQHLAVPESTSNVPTPLARPSVSGEMTSSPGDNLPDPDKGEKIALPPSVASVATTQSIAPADDEQVKSSGRRLTLENLEDLQKLQLKDTAVQRWSIHPKYPLSLDPVDEHGVRIPPSRLEKHDSGESFQFLEESAGSRESSFPASLDSRGSPTLHMVSAHPSRAKRAELPTPYPESVQEDELASAAQSMFFAGSGTLADSIVITKENSGNTSMDTSDEDLKQVEHTSINDFAFRDKKSVSQKKHAALQTAQQIEGDGPSNMDDQPTSQLPLAQPTSQFPLATPPHASDHDTNSGQAVDDIAAWTTRNVSPADSVVGNDPYQKDLEEEKPWTLIEMLDQFVTHYTVSQPYPQMAAALVLLVGPLLPRTHALPMSEIQATVSHYVETYLALGWDAAELSRLIKQCYEQPLLAGLRPLHVEQILTTYHEQLLQHGMWREAASLRDVCYPAYPAVWEDFIKDNGVHIKQDGEARCAICWEHTSPWAAKGGLGLFSACLLCGHSGHMECCRAWYAGEDGQGCPTEGCLCDCIAGSWRDEKGGVLEAQKGFVKEDSFTARESSAVEGARKALN
ncbi:WD40-repeat-containing protein [Dothistroma septosporum NZE10]|uniref:WD40-repeat-containing protein n=1 Tax=Dothistroma septosporum (strain NZE10 / CBS 128990) TaxID=675120 RepID=N1PWY0_DOTSN|nr:WD40-repeat-containing protein [Dothistroma septosporum NZE10]